MHKTAITRTRRRHRHGYTILELVACSFIVGLMIVPSTVFMRDAIRFTARMENRAIMHSLCFNAIEVQCAQVSETFKTAKLQGDFSTQGYPNFAFQTIASSSKKDGGIPNLLMVIKSSVWEDLDKDRRLDADELAVTLETKIAHVEAEE